MKVYELKDDLPEEIAREGDESTSDKGGDSVEEEEDNDSVA